MICRACALERKLLVVADRYRRSVDGRCLCCKGTFTRADLRVIEDWYNPLGKPEEELWGPPPKKKRRA